MLRNSLNDYENFILLLLQKGDAGLPGLPGAPGLQGKHLIFLFLLINALICA